MKNILNDLFKDMDKYLSEFKQVQNEFSQKIYKVSGAGGMINIEINGERKILAINISDDLIAMNDKKMLEDLLVASINQAYQTAEEDFTNIAQDKFSQKFMDKFNNFTGENNL
jgi:hypothetical protein